MLLIVLFAIAAIVLTPIAIMGGSIIIVFGDLIVFGLILWLIIKLIKRAKNGF
jgi:hypothetical protein